jgi:zinc transporter ZupT
VLLVFAITLHNIAEGLAAGVAFYALASDLPSATLAGAMIYVVVEELIPESHASLKGTSILSNPFSYRT